MRRLQDKVQLCESSKKTEKLIKERDETKKQLELKEQELHFLHRHQEDSAKLQIRMVVAEKEAELQKRHQKDNADLRVVIAAKEAEIKFLNEKLSEVERELISERKKNEELHERLQQTTADLAEQCERVRWLERSRAELERERRRVDTRIMLETAGRMVDIIIMINFIFYINAHSTHTCLYVRMYVHAYACKYCHVRTYNYIHT